MSTLVVFTGAIWIVSLAMLILDFTRPSRAHRWFRWAMTGVLLGATSPLVTMLAQQHWPQRQIPAVHDITLLLDLATTICVGIAIVLRFRPRRPSRPSASA